MTSWQTVWRDGLTPHLSTPGLRALEQALLTDDPRLLQGATTSPPLLACVADWPAEGACLIGFCGWQGEGLMTVGEVGDYFDRLCCACDASMGEPAGVRWLLNRWDESPRAEMLPLLLAEVQRTLAQRQRREAGAA